MSCPFLLLSLEYEGERGTILRKRIGVSCTMGVQTRKAMHSECATGEGLGSDSRGGLCRGCARVGGGVILLTPLAG